MDDEVFTMDDSNLSPAIENGVSKEFGMSMEIAAFNQVSMNLERQLDEKSPCQGANKSFSCVEAEQSELIGCIFDSDVDAYEAYSKPLRLVQRKGEIELELCLLLIIMVIATSIFTIF
ncbi:uncharacterized protein LOC141646259 [Silene latifolia]|uniref:uncharacterized protein LOC141586869 n=1 Tax=Silene latifolia TaxID=37657 RepID=UPI003D7892B6